MLDMRLDTGVASKFMVEGRTYLRLFKVLVSGLVAFLRGLRHGYVSITVALGEVKNISSWLVICVVLILCKNLC